VLHKTCIQNDPDALRQRIELERKEELCKHQDTAHDRKQRQPKLLDPDFTNAVIDACRVKLRGLEESGQEKDPAPPLSPPPASGATTPLNDDLLPSIIVKPKFPLFLEGGSLESSHSNVNQHACTLPSKPHSISRSFSPSPAPNPPTPKSNLFAPNSLAAESISDLDVTKRQPPQDLPRPGPLNRDQLREIKLQLEMLEQWMMVKAEEWNVSLVTITTNMGLDNRESHAPNFWNIFQSVFWEHALRDHPEINNDQADQGIC